MNLRAFFIKKASDFSPMPCYSIRLLCVLLHLHCEPRSEAEGVFEDSCFSEAYVLVPASRHRRIVVVCRLRLLVSGNALLWGGTRQKRYAIVFDLATRSISKIAFFRRAFSSTTAMRILMFDRESGEREPTA